MNKTHTEQFMAKTLLDAQDIITHRADSMGWDVVDIAMVLVPGSSFPYQGLATYQTKTTTKKKELVE